MEQIRTRRTGMRALLACALLALGAVSLPARAADTGPALLSTSIDNEWGPSGPITARFDDELATKQSGATLADKDGADIPGDVTFVGSTSSTLDSIRFTPRLSNGQTMKESQSRYTITFTATRAHALYGETVAGTSVVTRTFILDATQPVARITSPASSDGTPLVFMSSDGLAIEGTAVDSVSADDVKNKNEAHRSGLAAKVEVQFYNALKNFKPAGGSVEIRELRQTPDLTPCDTEAACATGMMKWAADITGLGTGQWTVKAYAIDNAGNRSPVAQVSFVKLT